MAEAVLHDRIQWHEGMLLAPQHFQQESARVDALVGWQALAGQPAAWGVRRLVVDEALLTRGMLRISLLEAIMPDGMAVRFDAATSQDATLELDLAPSTSLGAAEVPVYLVVGTARSLRLPGQPSMFRPIAGSLVVDEVSEALDEEVPRMAARVALMAGPPPGAAWVALQLMTVVLDNEIVRRGSYWPAQLAVVMDSPLGLRARALAVLMRAKAVFLAQQSATNASRLEDRMAMLEVRAQLASVTVNLPMLEATLALPVVQPLALYLALCAQLGALAALRPGAVPLAPPDYVHTDSYRAFDAVLASLESLALEVSQQWRSVPFTFDDGLYTLALQPGWLTERMVIGLRGQSEPELAAWMTGATIGSRTVSASLRDRRMPGAARTPIASAPELGLRAATGTVLFEVAADQEFIVAGQELVISNENGAGKGARGSVRPQEIVLFIEG